MLGRTVITVEASHRVKGRGGNRERVRRLLLGERCCDWDQGGALEVGRRNQIQDTFCRKGRENLLRGGMRGARQEKDRR